MKVIKRLKKMVRDWLLDDGSKSTVVTFSGRFLGEEFELKLKAEEE